MASLLEKNKATKEDLEKAFLLVEGRKHLINNILGYFEGYHDGKYKDLVSIEFLKGMVDNMIAKDMLVFTNFGVKSFIKRSGIIEKLFLQIHCIPPVNYVHAADGIPMIPIII